MTLVAQISRKRIDAQASVDNRGARATGPEEVVLEGAFNAATALGDRTEVVLYNTPFDREEIFGQASETVLLGRDVSLKGDVVVDTSATGTSTQVEISGNTIDTGGISNANPLRTDLTLTAGSTAQNAITLRGDITGFGQLGLDGPVLIASPTGSLLLAAPVIPNAPCGTMAIGGRDVVLDATSEILAKKLLYRADGFKARDAFDMSVALALDRPSAIAALAATTRTRPALLRCVRQPDGRDSSFLKKRSKRILLDKDGDMQEQKFFGPFFQKRTAFYSLFFATGALAQSAPSSDEMARLCSRRDWRTRRSFSKAIRMSPAPPRTT